jgi:cytochrome c-type biogenesis protein CcmH
VTLGAAGIYIASSGWSWSTQPVGTPQAMVASLARRLERHPDDLEGWLMLGRSYIVLEQPAHAARAYQRANELAQGRSAEALIGIGEALTLSDEAELAARAGPLFEAALDLEPTSGKALFFGAAAALQRGEPALARERFAKLLTLDPPPEVREILEQQIAAIDRESSGDEAADRPRVRVNVDIAPALRERLASDAPLYVIIREADKSGPPLAVKRVAARFPQSVELTAADAMVAGRDFATGQSVQVVARIAQSGSATAQSGDPFGEARYAVGREDAVQILIDRLTP